MVLEVWHANLKVDVFSKNLPKRIVSYFDGELAFCQKPFDVMMRLTYST